jgi:hypothetical protein
VPKLEAWPHHRLSFAVAACFGFLAALSATDGELEWYFWVLLVSVGGWIILGVRELRRDSQSTS